MKRYIQMIAVLVVIVLLVSLSGCIIIPLSKYYNIPAEEVVSVQFYDLRNQNANGGTGFNQSEEPVYTVPEEEREKFLKDFSTLEFTDTIIIVLAAIDPSFSYGEWVVRINFTNGQYTFYSCAGYGETYNAEGKCVSSTHFSCNDEELEKLIGKYYEIE